MVQRLDWLWKVNKRLAESKTPTAENNLVPIGTPLRPEAARK